jgi:hypothetical protein
MEDKDYKAKYLKYKAKYLELKYGGGGSSLLSKGLKLMSNLLSDIDIEKLIPSDVKNEFNTQLTTYLNNINNDNVKLYLEDANLIKPILQDIGEIFLTNLNEIMDNINNIVQLKDKTLTEEDIKTIKNNLAQIQKDLVKIKIKKPLKTAIILPQISLKYKSLTSNITALKKSNLIKSIPALDTITKKLKLPF